MLTAAALIPVVLLLVFRAPLWLFAVAVAVIIAAALHEYLGMVEAAGLKPFRCLVYVAGVLPIILLLGSILRARLVDHPSQNFYPPGLMLKTWCEIAFLAALIFGIPLIFRKDMAQGLASVAA
ncbi:MAG TPA: hypothetical protein VKL99_14190, partial [Candidatus Angelobacter sp.]|nr:hypothetical protein [Candidatus Angelobacter sp.]